MSTNHAYTPYGAFELKASYQKNMLIGNLSVIGIVTLLLILGWYYSVGAETPLIVEPINKPIWKPSKTKPMDPNRMRPKAPKPLIQIRQGTIPTMVPDSLFLDEDSIVLTPSNIIYDIVSDGDEPFDPKLMSGGGDGVVGVVGFEPDENIFIPYEKEPEMIFHVQPEYPRLCKQAGIEGDVVIKVLIDKEGNVLKAKVIKSSKNESLDKAALIVATQNKFSPALQNTIPISLWVSYTVRFRLQ